MKDVAKRAGTSVYTVSSVINNSNPVSLKLRKRVQKAIRELDYIPDQTARDLKKRRTFSVGVIISDMSDIFYSQVVKSIEKIMNLEKVSVTICNTNNDPDKEKEYIDFMIQKKVDGLIIFTIAQDDKNLRKIIDRKIPLVMIDREIESLNVNTVVMDDFKAVFGATNYLIDKGHKRIGIVSYPITLSTGFKRIEGYKNALKKNNISLDEKLIKIGGFITNDSFKATEELLKDKRVPPTAIVTTNLKMFLGAMKYIRLSNLEIPSDISLITVGDFEWLNLMSPPISAIKFPVAKMGEHAAKLLLEEINLGIEKFPKKIVLSTKLIERNSVKDIRNNLR